MTVKERISSFISLGKEIDNIINHLDNENYQDDLLINAINRSTIYNPWFTKDHIHNSLNAISSSLNEEKVNKWLSNYTISDNTSPKKVGVVMAGNIPLVGFHDMLCVLISGNIFIGKTSSKDNELIKAVAEKLIQINPLFKDFIIFEDSILKDIDAIIATGSNNSARYFEYYFSKYPNIIRKNRNSVAILSGNESKDDLKKLGDDIFLYFGLGCRNVSKLFVPEDYNFDDFFKSNEDKKHVINHTKYSNNFDYNKSIYLMNLVEHLDNGFLLLKEDQGYSSPISVLFYERYSDKDILAKQLNSNTDRLQCVVGNCDINYDLINFGDAQKPELWDYADNIDTIDFLTKL